MYWSDLRTVDTTLALRDKREEEKEGEVHDMSEGVSISYRRLSRLSRAVLSERTDVDVESVDGEFTVAAAAAEGQYIAWL